MKKAGLCSALFADTHPLFDLFTFKLSEYRHNSDHCFSHRCTGVEILGHADKIHTVCIEHIIDHIKDIFLRPAQTIQLVNNNFFDLMIFHIPDQLLNARSI